MISVENVSRKYGDFAAVDDISFTILPGEIVGLLGHNGAGKTTIMKMLTGFLEPTHGEISIYDRSISKERREIQKDVGYLPENCPVYPEMTVIDYLDYSASLHGIPSGQRKEMVAKAIARTALAEKAHQTIATLSRGYRQRAGVAQAILHDPKILVLDEPTNGLDPTQIKQMRELIVELSENSTVIISTHILQEVQAVCDRVIIVNTGKIVVDSRLDSLQQGSRLLLCSENREGLQDNLEALPGITAVEKVGAHQTSENGVMYALSIAEEKQRDQIAALVSKEIIQKGLSLYSMQYESRDLESVFAQVSEQ